MKDGALITFDAIGRAHMYTCAAIRGHYVLRQEGGREIAYPLGTWAAGMTSASAVEYIKRVVRR